MGSQELMSAEKGIVGRRDGEGVINAAAVNRVQAGRCGLRQDIYGAIVLVHAFLAFEHLAADQDNACYHGAKL
jgi:hypothetical protein